MGLLASRDPLTPYRDLDEGGSLDDPRDDLCAGEGFDEWEPEEPMSNVNEGEDA